MNITYYGLNCFRIQDNSLSILLNPFEASSGLILPRMQNDLVLCSRPQLKKDHPEKTFIIDSPGEYEIKDCFVYGIPVDGDQEGPLIFLLELEGVKVAYLGFLKNAKLTDQQLERLAGVDVLMIPVGGGDSLNEKQATELVNQLEARLVIPMNYQLPRLKVKLESIEKFKKEMGLKAEEIDKLKVAKRDLPQEETRLVILNPSS